MWVLGAWWGHRLGLRAPGQASFYIRLCLRCLLLHSCSHLFWRNRKGGEKTSWFMPPLLPFPVLIYENKIPVNSSGISTRQLWGQAFSYTAQCKRLAVLHALVMCFGLQCRSQTFAVEGWVSERGLSAGSQSDLDSRHTSYLPAASFFFFPAPINPPAAIKSTTLTRPLS